MIRAWGCTKNLVEMENGDSITVVICLLTAMVRLIASWINYNARQLAELMFEVGYKHRGLPKNIISDRDILFTSTFWGYLHKLIGTKLKMSSAYHPQTDGSTERANKTVAQMLGQCINAKKTDWVAKLPAIEFAINSARSESTGFAPFSLNSGRMPRSMIWNSASPTEFPYPLSDPTGFIMAKSPSPSFKRYYTHLDPPIPATLRTVLHPYISHISDVPFIVTDTFASPIQHYAYAATAIIACLTHDSAIRDDPAGIKDQSCPIRFNILARVYNAKARGTQRFAYYAPHPSSNPVITYGDRIQPDDWNITPTQRGIVIKNPGNAARNLGRKATIQSQIEKRHAIRSHKRDNDAIKQFAATHRTKADSKLKGKKKAHALTPTTTTIQPVASGSAVTFESLLPPVASSAASDITMSGPSNTFTLTDDEMLAAFNENASPIQKDTTFENGATFDFETLPNTTM